jgi:hypothetical protein
VGPVRFAAAQKTSTDTGARSLTLSARTSPDHLRVMMIDGDRNGRYVLFDHDGHAERNGGKNACFRCHHMNKPFDQATPCSACHADAFMESSIFQHSLHVRKVEGRHTCSRCHRDPERPKSFENSAGCGSCHTEMVVSGAFVKAPGNERFMKAPGYVDAVHGLCEDCHRRSAAERVDLGEDFGRCGTCHLPGSTKALKELPPYSNIRLEF